jgi:hypothetical protein
MRLISHFSPRLSATSNNRESESLKIVLLLAL